MSLAPGQRIGPYEIIGPLGEGGMGQVWRARDMRLGREVALKVLPELFARDGERRQRFEREAQVLASLNHPNVAAIYGVEDAGGAPALVLELVEGPTLADRMGRGAIPPDEALPIARQIAEALEYAHEHGVVHRDLKPANVKLDPEGRAKVLDFGLAKALLGDLAGRSDPSLSPTLTSLGTTAGTILGTAAYMSPEQARGSSVDRRTDIWAFGAVVWEMLAGQRIFEGETVSDTLAAVLRAPVDWGALPASTPPRVVQLLQRCLERDAKKRLRDIGEARIVLESVASGPSGEVAGAAGAEALEGASAAAAGPRPARALGGRRRFPPLLIALLALVGAVAVIGIVAAVRGPSANRAVVRFQVPPAADITTMEWPRLSPDGQTIAFIARKGSDAPSIWIRPLDAFAPYPLAGTEGATRPFWSPDGKYLAFTVDSQELKKIPVGGGPSQLICEADGASDGSWGADGVILFDGRTTDPIRRVPATGGVAAVESSADASRGERSRFWPEFLPDGRHFVMVVAGTDGNRSRSMIHVAELGAPGSTSLTPTDSRVEYANGHLVYVLQGTLVAHRFDPDSLSIEGDPVPLASNVVANQSRADFSLSELGDLAFLSSQAGMKSQLIWVDRKGEELGLVGEPGAFRDLALSPDELKVAYGLFDDREGDDIWVKDLRRDVVMRLTTDPANDVWPIWSPDGARILFSSNRGGPTYSLLAKASTGTGAEETIYAPDGTNVGVGDIFPDGSRAAVMQIVPGNPWDIVMVPLKGARTPEPYLSDARTMEWQPRVSPDGRWVAYTSTETGPSEVYVQTYPPSGAKWTISRGGGRDPVWRGDGKEIVYRAPDDEIVAVPITLGASLEAGLPQRLFKHRLEATGMQKARWVMTRDGQRFLLNAALESAVVPPFSVVLNWPMTLK